MREREREGEMALFGNDQRNVLVVLIISLHSGKENISNQTKSRRKSLQFCCHSKKNCKSRTSLSQSTKEIFNLAGFIVDSVQLSLERTERPLIVSRPEQYQEPQVGRFHYTAGRLSAADTKIYNDYF